MATRMQQRRGTAAQWTAANPVLAAGEIGFETDTNQFKMGDGSNTWSALSYFKNLEDLGGLDDFVTYAEIGDASDPANYTRTAPLNADGLIPLAYMAKLVEGSNANLDTFAELGSAIDQLNEHADSTVGPHGISDTSNLAYLNDSRFTDERTPEDLSVVTAKIADSAVTAVKIADLAIGTSKIADNAVTTAKINDGNVTAGKLATDSVTTIKIADNAVTNDKIADDAVTATQLATSAVETLKINDLAVTTAKIDNSSVTSGKIAAGAVETTNIANSAVTADKIEAGAVGSSELATDSVTTVKIADDAVTSAKILAGAVGASELETSAVETSKINDLAVTSGKIADGAVISVKIADAAVTGSKIADNAISQSHLGDDSVGTNELGGLSVTTGKIAALAVTDAKIAADAVTTAKVADLAITSAKINDDAVTSLKIADDAVETAHIVDANVTAGKLATDSVTTIKIADGAVTSAKILAGAVGSSQLATDSVETAKIADGAVTSAKIADLTIVDGDISASAAIAQSKIDGLSASLSAKADLAGPTFTGTVSGITKTMVGLGNVDNTSDASKPVSTATQTALDAKASLAGATFTGNVEMDGNLVVDGDFTVNGTNFSASATSITIEDNMVQLAHQNAANTVDLGLVVGYNDGVTKHSGIVRDVSADKWKLFKGVTTEPSTTVDFTQGSLDALQVGALEATTVTPSSGIVFSDGTQLKAGVPSITAFATEITSSATLAAGEADKFVPLNGAVQITLPATGYSTGQSIDFWQSTGTGASFASTNGVVGTPGRNFRTTNSVVTAMKTATGWLIFGDLSA
jgi:hypothetical protein